jgi:hypothetical protein
LVGVKRTSIQSAPASEIDPKVPDDRIVTEANRAGRPMVWPHYFNGNAVIRCFMPRIPKDSMIERSPESLSSAPPPVRMRTFNSACCYAFLSSRQADTFRVGAAAPALLDFDTATHADLAAANGGDLCLRKRPSLRLSPCQTGDVGSDFKHTGVHKFLFK